MPLPVAGAVGGKFEGFDRGDCEFGIDVLDKDDDPDGNRALEAWTAKLGG
jgi:hypothetical protein